MTDTTAVRASGEAPTGASVGLSLGALTALVVGSMIGAGIFNLPRQMASVASPLPLVIGWAITGLGMLTLAIVFQSLSLRKHEIDGGVYGYARAGFGPYLGFNSAWGYWISAWIGNVGFLVLLFSALGYFFPAFDGGTTPAAVVGASVLLWATTALCIRGVREAAFVNVLVTIAKIVPLLVFVAIAVVAFKADLFSADLWGSSTSVMHNDQVVPLGGTLDQVKGMMLYTVWVFIGIEGASIFSARAKNRSDVGKATVIGFAGVLALLVAITLLSYGLLKQADLAGVKDPALGTILESVVGPWGGALIAVGLIISLLGAFLSWTLLCAEILRLPSKEDVLPAALGRDNRFGAPTWGLVVTAICTQITLVWASRDFDAYDTLTLLASALILLPYLFSTAYQLKIALSGESYAQETGARRRDLCVGAVATVYAVWLIYAAGVDYLFIAALFYLAGTVLYVITRVRAHRRVFSTAEVAIALVVLAAAVYAVFGLSTGSITL